MFRLCDTHNIYIYTIYVYNYIYTHISASHFLIIVCQSCMATIYAAPLWSHTCHEFGLTTGWISCENTTYHQHLSETFRWIYIYIYIHTNHLPIIYPSWVHVLHRCCFKPYENLPSTARCCHRASGAATDWTKNGGVQWEFMDGILHLHNGYPLVI